MLRDRIFRDDWQTAANAEHGVVGDWNGAPIAIREPARRTLPVVCASPHSGRSYPAAFVAASRLSAHALRKSEDGFVDELFAEAPELGAPLLRAEFPRAFVDVNREAYELDPAMFEGRPPSHVNVRSPRVAAGLGTIARIVSSGEQIYRGKLTYAEAERRIDACYRPYHQALDRLVARTRQKFGWCILLDCHSMPSAGARMGGANLPAIDFVLGDRHGSSCAPAVIRTAERTLSEGRRNVSFNTPYAGGFTTRHYGRPHDGVHALQIEINRALYMDERRIARRRGASKIAALMAKLVTDLGRIAPQDLGVGNFVPEDLLTAAQ